MVAEGASRVLVRLGIGLVQGLILAGLYLADDYKVFPATVPQLFAPLIAVAVFVPFLVSQALGNLRRTTLAVWSLAATALVAGLAWYNVWHVWPAADAPTLSPRIIFIIAIFLFVAHALVSCGDADRRILARYPTLFDLAWKLGVQIAIVLCFLAAFWIMLWLGISLFNMIGFNGFGRFITAAAVAIPLTTIAAAAALHATDTSAPLLRGVRGLALTLLSWLLPVIAAITLAFLVSLAVTGLQPLWATRRAAFLLIAAVVVLVMHINAAYQDGDANPPHILRVAGTLAAVLLAFLVWIAAYALWLRVGQYGWTVDRITSAGCVAVAGVFALGYLIAAVLPGPWLKFIEHWNVYSTLFFLIVLFALATPIADPMRLSVADQVQRLKVGQVKPEKFDFEYLAFSGGRFGHDALISLRTSNVAAIRNSVRNALAANERRFVPPEKLGRTPNEIAHYVTVHPGGRVLPQSFLQQDWKDGVNTGVVGGNCLNGIPVAGAQCDALLVDLDGDGSDEIVLVLDTTAHSLVGGYPWWTADIFRWDGKRWVRDGSIEGRHCAGAYEALLAGRFKLLSPERRPLADLELGGRRVHVSPVATPEYCEK